MCAARQRCAVRASVFGVVVALGFAACSGSDSDSTGTPPATSPSTETETTVAETTPPQAQAGDDSTQTEPNGDTEESTQAIEDATGLLDEWVAAWNAGDADAVAAIFLPDAVLITSDGVERSGERAGAYIARFVSRWPTLARTTDGQPNDDGAVSFDIEWTSPVGTIVPRTLDITTSNGSLVSR